jgi:hypothetical protein
MGEYDSSKTRVAPVFNKLLERDPTGRDWLSRLLQLPQRFDGVEVPLPDTPTEIVEHGWHPKERIIPPPAALLRWLVERDPAQWPPEFRESGKTGIPKRDDLFAGDAKTRQEALQLLEAAPERAWYVLEGPTHVDAYIETKDLVVVIEGKRTERAPTTRTKWMETRHQMLRNLDAVWDSGKRACGFFVVEGAGDSTAIPQKWEQFARETVSTEALAGSLPHRSDDERGAIAEAFLGVTTWQRICEEFGIPLSELADTTG